MHSRKPRKSDFVHSHKAVIDLGGGDPADLRRPLHPAHSHDVIFASNMRPTAQSKSSTEDAKNKHSAGTSGISTSRKCEVIDLRRLKTPLENDISNSTNSDHKKSFNGAGSAHPPTSAAAQDPATVLRYKKADDTMRK